MRKATLFIAMSLDGYVAEPDGAVDWLQGQEPEQNDLLQFEAFIQDIDTILMGWRTYHQITTALSPGQWPYADLTSYVFTHQDLPATANIHFVQGDICSFVQDLRQISGKGIWICGGPSIIHPLIQANLIDCYHLSIIPTLLGGGIRLFEPMQPKRPLRLVQTKHYNGIVDVIYQPR